MRTRYEFVDYAARAIRGTIVHAPLYGELEVLPRGIITVNALGIITGVYSECQAKAKGIEHTIDLGNKLILQAMCDMHLHAPQYPMMGLGTELELLDWLRTYTYPMERKFFDLSVARDTSYALAKELIQNGTTRICAFSSSDVDSTLELMRILEAEGLHGYVGKVNMDRNCNPLVQETTEQSVTETQKWLICCNRHNNIKPIITPRFTPACTDTLMKELGVIADMEGLRVQSHLSENLDEIDWVTHLVPGTTHYWQSYKQAGLWKNKTLMAHCVWSDDNETSAMQESGVYMVHCPTSNMNLASGFADAADKHRKHVKVVLGSDIGAGHTLNMFDVMASAVQTSKHVEDLLEDRLTVAQAYYMATSAAQEWFDQEPGFCPGNEFHALVVDDSQLPNSDMLTPQARLERLLYKRQQDWLVAVFAKERCLYNI